MPVWEFEVPEGVVSEEIQAEENSKLTTYMESKQSRFSQA